MKSQNKNAWDASISGMPSDSDFKYAYATLVSYLKQKYDIDVIETHPSSTETFHGLSDDRVADFDPYVSDGDGRSITLHKDIPAEFKVYSVLHLFGHILQNNESEANRKISAEKLRSDPEYMSRLENYERCGSQYGLGLLIACNQKKLIPWLSITFRADWQFLQDVCHGRVTELPDPDADISELLQARKEQYFPAALEGEDLTPLTLPKTIEEIGAIQHPDNGYTIL